MDKDEMNLPFEIKS